MCTIIVVHCKGNKLFLTTTIVLKFFFIQPS